MALKNCIAHEDSTTLPSLTWTNKKRDDDNTSLDHDHNVERDPATQSIAPSGATSIGKEECSRPSELSNSMRSHEPAMLHGTCERYEHDEARAMMTGALRRQCKNVIAKDVA